MFEGCSLESIRCTYELGTRMTIEMGHSTRKDVSEKESHKDRKKEV